jgi:hypothetical protein
VIAVVGLVAPLNTVNALSTSGASRSVVQDNPSPDRPRVGLIVPPPDVLERGDVTELKVFSLSINPIATIMWPSWRQTAVLTAVTNQGTVTLSPQVAAWSTSDVSVATVDGNGLVRAISPGTFDLRASYQGVEDVYTLTVNAPVRPAEFGPIEPFLATPKFGDQYEVPIVIIRYLPTADGVNLDVSFDPDFYSLNQVTLARKKSDIDGFDRWLKFMVEEATRFRGYKNPLALPALGYRVVDYITVYEPTPPGKVLFQSQRSPSDPSYPVYSPDVWQILDRFNGRHYVEGLGVKEFWLWTGGVDSGYPSFDPAIHKPESFRSVFESNMSSPITGDISNSFRDPTDLPIYNRTYLVYGQNFRRSQAEAMHNRGHQVEAMFSYISTSGRQYRPVLEEIRRSGHLGGLHHRQVRLDSHAAQHDDRLRLPESKPRCQRYRRLDTRGSRHNQAGELLYMGKHCVRLAWCASSIPADRGAMVRLLDAKHARLGEHHPIRAECDDRLVATRRGLGWQHPGFCRFVRSMLSRRVV